MWEIQDKKKKQLVGESNDQLASSAVTVASL
jgi:hypothetical protein